MDYKDIQQLRGRTEPLPPGRWLPYFGAGLGIGLGIAVLVYLQEHNFARPLLHFVAASPSPQETTETIEAPLEFEFYTVLPKMEVRINDWDLEAATEGGKSLPTSPYFLQSESYRQPMAADQLQQRLLQAGVETHIQSVELGDSGIRYRVRAGPYHTLQELNRTRSQLTQNGVHFMLLRKAATSPPPEANQ